MHKTSIVLNCARIISRWPILQSMIQQSKAISYRIISYHLIKEFTIDIHKINMDLYIDIRMHIYIYIYIHINEYMNMYICIVLYIYMHTYVI
jgi:hypothetical protein